MHLSTVFLIFSVLLFQLGDACMSGDPNNPLGTTGTTQPTTQAATESTTPLTTPAATTTENPYVSACKAVGADFGNGDNGGYTPTKFDSQDKRIDNKGTGVPKPFEGKPKYMGAKLKPGEKAILSSAPVSFTSDKNILVNYYEATDGIVLKGCSNDESNCKDISNKGIKKEDLQWQKGNFPVSSSTNKVLLVAENTGTNLGAVGVDKIGISDAANGPDHCAGSTGPSGN